MRALWIPASLLSAFGGVTILVGVEGTYDVGTSALKWTQDTVNDSHLVYQPSDGSPPWVTGHAIYGNPVGGRSNHVYSFGWNLMPGSGRVVGGGETAVGYGFESFFKPDDGHEYMEHHLYFMTAADVQRRPMSYLLNRQTGEVQTALSGERITLSRDTGGLQSLVVQNDVDPVTFTFGRWKQLRSTVRFDYGDSPAIQQNSAYGYVEICRVNAAGNVVIANGGAPTKIGGAVGFNGRPPIAKPTITGSRGGNEAVANLLTQLANYGLITDATTP